MKKGFTKKMNLTTICLLTVLCLGLFVFSINQYAAAFDSNVYYNIAARHSGKAMEVYNFSTKNGGNVVQCKQWNGDNQQWQINDLGNGYFSIINKYSGKALEVYDFSRENGGDVVQWDYWGGENQQWLIEEMVSGYYTITNRLSGKVLDVMDLSTTDGANIIQWGNFTTYNQLWEITQASSVHAAGTIPIYETIVVGSGETYDGGGVTIVAVGMGDGSQDEHQDPIFRLEDGATLKNVRIAYPGCDGVHVYGNAAIQNVVWEDVGEDALTVKEGGTVVVSGGAAYNAADKIFQLNDACTFIVNNFTAGNFGKLVRQCGGTYFKCTIYIENVTLTDGDECIARTDSTSTQLYYSNIKAYNCDHNFEWWIFPSLSQVHQF